MPAQCGSQDCCSQCPNPMAGHCWPTPPVETPRHWQASRAQSLVGSLLLSPATDVHMVLLCPPRVCFLGCSQSFCQIPRLGNLLWALELCNNWELWYNFSAVCGSSVRWLHSWANGNLLQDYLCHMPCLPGLLQPELLSPWQVTAEPCLHRRRSNTETSKWVNRR